MFKSKDSSSKMADFPVTTYIDWIPRLCLVIFLWDKLGFWFPCDSALNWKLLRIKIMKQTPALKRSGYSCESLVNNFVSQAGLLGDVWCPGCFMTSILNIDYTVTSCSADISLLSNKYSIFWNLLPYSYWIIEIYTL